MADVTLEKEVERLCRSAEAFLHYFNPAMLPSDKEKQWLALSDQVMFARIALTKREQKEPT